MSRGNKLQEMEVDVKESNAVTAGAAAADKSLPKAGSNAAGVSTPGNSGSWEDLGGPTPENYKVDDDSAKLKTPGATLKQVKDVVNKGAKSGVKSGDVQPGTSLNSGDEVEVKADQEVVAEEPAKEDEVVAEEDLRRRSKMQLLKNLKLKKTKLLLNLLRKKLHLNSISKKMLKHFSKERNYLKSSKQKQRLSSRQQSILRLQQLKRN